MQHYVSIGQASEIIGVAISTLRRWEYEGKLFPSYRTKGGHRRYTLKYLHEKVLDLPRTEQIEYRTTVAYARVSSADQKLDLERQKKRLANHCIAQNWNYEVISDLGSGINMNKKGLNKLINLICHGKVGRLILTHKDRLLRFGSPLLFKLCKFYNTEVIILETTKPKNFQEELAADVIEILTVFTAKMYGKRSYENRKSIICEK